MRFLVASALVLLACENAPPQPSAEPTTGSVAPNSAGTAAARGSTKSYGAPLTGSASSVALTEILAQPDQYEGKNVSVEGEVRRACTKKGCWMELAEGLSDAARGARVTFKDYGFFVPLDSAGAHAKLEGVVNVKTLKPGQVEHLEQEGAKLAKNADGTAKEVHFVATGVELTK